MPTSANPVRPVLIDVIGEVTEPLASMSTISSLVSLLTLAYKVKIPPPSERERLATLMYTMASDRANSSNHDDLLGSFLQFVSPVLNGMAGMEDFQAAVEAFSKPDDFRDFWTIEGHNLIRELVGGDGCPIVVKSSDKAFLDVFVKDTSCKIGYGRDTGCLLLVPGDCAVEDQVWRQEDAAHPEVLRKAGESWTKIGHAFADLECRFGELPQK